MKLTKKEIDVIVDDASQGIYDDVWAELNIEFVEEYILDNTANEYDNEDLNEILKRLQDIQKEIQEEYISEEEESLYQEIDEFIHDTDIHLSHTNIGKVLTKLANYYLHG
jgi:hypothetical protein